MNKRQEELQKQINELIIDYFNNADDLPVNDLPLSNPLYDEKEVISALDSLLSQNVTMGKKVLSFEKNFAKYVGSKHAIMVNSGSSANLLAIAALSELSVKNGLRPGDEVIVPAVTWSTTISPLLQFGLVPVIVDIDPQTLNLDTSQLENAFSSKTKAIMPVHLLGNPCDMATIMQFANKHKLLIIEDNCESLGSEYNNKQTGTFGEFGTFSFYFSHHITTIEGGMLVTDDDHLSNIARSLRAHGWTREMANKEQVEAMNPHIDPRFLFVNVGYNFRPMETQAAFGIIQLEKLPMFNMARRENHKHLVSKLSHLHDKITFVNEEKDSTSTWFGFSVILNSEKERNELRDYLESRNVATRPIVAGNLALQPAFRDNPKRIIGNLENATMIGERGLFIGNSPNLTLEQLDYIISCFNEHFNNE